MKKGCAIAAGSTAALMVATIGGCIYIAEQYEKDHPELAQSVHTLLAAELEVMAFESEAAHGNNDEARAIAKPFSLAMKMAREVFFTGSDTSKASLTGGQFITYCNLLPDKCAFIVHVPQLRNYSADAQTEMAALAWRMAVNVLRDRPALPKELAVGIRGPMNYGQIIIGVPSATDDPMEGIRERTNRVSVLYPFFTAPADSPLPKP